MVKPSWEETILVLILSDPTQLPRFHRCITIYAYSTSRDCTPDVTHEQCIYLKNRAYIIIWVHFLRTSVLLSASQINASECTNGTLFQSRIVEVKREMERWFPRWTVVWCQWREIKEFEGITKFRFFIYLFIWIRFYLLQKIKLRNHIWNVDYKSLVYIADIFLSNSFNI